MNRREYLKLTAGSLLAFPALTNSLNAATAALKPMQRAERPRGLDEFCKMVSTLVPPANNPIIGIAGLPKSGKTTLLRALIASRYAEHCFVIESEPVSPYALMLLTPKSKFEFSSQGSSWAWKSESVTQVVVAQGPGHSSPYELAAQCKNLQRGPTFVLRNSMRGERELVTMMDEALVVPGMKPPVGMNTGEFYTMVGWTIWCDALVSTRREDGKIYARLSRNRYGDRSKEFEITNA